MAAERRSSNDYNASSRALYQDEVGGDDESWARDDFDDDEHNAVYDDDGYARRRYGGGDEGEEGDDERWGAVRVSAADVERYDDATTLLGDVSVTTDVHSVRQCHELCVSEPACAAWTLDKYRYVCLLRLLNVSTVRYSADYIGGRLDASELATRAADWGDADADVEAAAAAREAEGEEAGGGGLKFVAQPAARYAGAPWALPSELRDGSGVLADVDLRGGDFKSVSARDSVAGAAPRAPRSRRARRGRSRRRGSSAGSSRRTTRASLRTDPRASSPPSAPPRRRRGFVALCAALGCRAVLAKYVMKLNSSTCTSSAASAILAPANCRRAARRAPAAALLP